MSGQFTLKLSAVKNDTSVAQITKVHKYDVGFAKSVKRIQKLAEGPWGWCTVTVTAEYKFGDKVLQGVDNLGECSYLSAADFICYSGGYFDDMVNTAIADLRIQLIIDGVVPVVPDAPVTVPEPQKQVDDIP